MEDLIKSLLIYFKMIRDLDMMKFEILNSIYLMHLISTKFEAFSSGVLDCHKLLINHHVKRFQIICVNINFIVNLWECLFNKLDKIIENLRFP
jgi:hypothetical protein